MSNYLEILLTAEKDAELVRFLEMNKGSDVSALLVCALEYYIETGEYLTIGRVCLKTVLPAGKIRKAIYVPRTSSVCKWAEELKAAKRGLMMIKIRKILKESLLVTEDTVEEFTEDPEVCILSMYDKQMDLVKAGEEISKQRDRSISSDAHKNREIQGDTAEKNENISKGAGVQASNLMDSLMPPAM